MSTRAATHRAPGSAGDEPEGSPTQSESRPWRVAALVVLPYVLLSICWLFSNPPGAAPDEADHLVKAIGNAQGQLGTDVAPLEPGGPIILERNNSTTRGFVIPADINPIGYACFAFDNTRTADCQPTATSPPGEVTAYSTLGDYPPFLYVPIGRAALLADTPTQAYYASRLVVLVVSSLLLLLGVSHLVRWLGRSAVLGYVALLTPAVVFLDGSLSPSAIELAAAAAVASVVTVAIIDPRTVHLPATHVTLAVSGSVLALTRQLGLLALAVLVVVLLLGVGWVHVRRLFVEHRLSFVLSVLVMGVASVAVFWWERTYDHPAHVGTPFRLDAVDPFLASSSFVLTSAIGNFGYLDTPMPSQASGVWIALWVLVISLGYLLGRRRETVTISAIVLGTGLLGFGIYASAFFPIQGGIQGRHFMPVFCLSLVLAGAVVARRAGAWSTALTSRLFVGTAVVAGVVQMIAIYANGRRYAVGMLGPWWWVPDARWEPPLGWVPWFVLAALASALLTAVVVWARPRADVGRPADLTPDRQAPASG